MSCKQAIEQMHEALDSGAADSPPEQARRHMEECQTCREVWERMRAMELDVSRFCDRERIEEPARLHEGIMEALDRPTAQPGRTARIEVLRPVLRWALAAAAVFAGVIGVHQFVVEPEDKPDRNPIAEERPTVRVDLADLETLNTILRNPAKYFGRGAPSAERLDAFIQSLPIPSPPTLNTDLSQIASLSSAWAKSERTAVVVDEIRGTMERFWDYGASTLRTFSSRGATPATHKLDG